MVEFPQKRLLFVALAACLALAFLWAGIFTLTHLDHDHTGEECSTCLQIEIAQAALKGFGLVFIAAALIDFSSAAGSFIKQIRRHFTYVTTPVILNIKSNT
jgi:flagellar biosynthesis protein FlhB